MTLKDLRMYRFNPSLSEGDEIKCHECNEFSPHGDWIDTEVYCEDCGSHPAIKCPKCHAIEDYVWHDPFETRVPCKTKDDE